MEGQEFLKHKYDLHNAPEVENAAKRTETKTGESIEKPLDKIQNYLDRFKEIIERTDEEEKQHGLRALKKILHDEYIIKPENIPESYFTLQQQIAREQGHGDIEITDGMREEAVHVIQADQRASMDEWIDYLASNDATYPDWAKYWAIRSVLGMSLYDKEHKRFGNRTKNTTAKFPDWNPEALAYAVDAIEKKVSGQKVKNPVKVGENEFADERKLVSDEEFQKIINTRSFAKYYAFALEHVVADNSELFKTTDGEWRVFEEGSDAKELTKTIQGHGTGWCTAGESTAEAQLEMGDFYIYYSNNVHGLPTIPRLAIRMEGDEIAEVRGVAHKQEIDPYISPILEKKIEDFGSEGGEYKQKAADMKLLTNIDNKTASDEPLTKDELRFLYELDREIEGFGYARDPRISEIIDKRNRIEDGKILLGETDPDKFLTKFLAMNDELLQAKLLNIPVYNDEVDDFFLFKKMQEKFVEETISQLSAISLELAKELIKDYNRFHSILLKNYNLMSKEDLLTILPELAEAINKDKQFAGIYPSIFIAVPPRERQKYLEEQIERGNHDFVGFIVRVSRDLPLHIAKLLVQKGYTDIVANSLETFGYGLDNEVALALIEAQYTYQLSEHLDLFRGLGAKVRQALEDAAYFNDLDRSPDSFDSSVFDLDKEEEDEDGEYNELKNYWKIDDDELP